MNIHRNVLKIVAGALLIASLPAGAQVLGGGLGGGLNGALGGGLGGAGVNGAGSAAGNANAGIDASDTFGAARDRARQVGGKTREVAGSAVGTASSRIESTRGAADASVQTTQSASTRASRRAARAAAQGSTSVEQTSAAQANTQPSGGLLLNGAGGASAERHAMGRTIAADGVAGSQTSADRSGLANSAYGQGRVSMKKDEPAAPPAPAETPPAQ